MSERARITEREAESYVGIHAEAHDEAEFRRAVDRGFPELFGWLAENGLEPSGAPLIRYRELDADGEPLEFELAAPVTAAVSATGPVHAGELPPGRYATLLHVGPFSHAEVPDLDSARAELLGWIRARGLAPAATPGERGTRPRACVERYLTDPSREADWSKWETELAYLVTEG